MKCSIQQVKIYIKCSIPRPCSARNAHFIAFLSSKHADHQFYSYKLISVCVIHEVQNRGNLNRICATRCANWSRDSELTCIRCIFHHSFHVFQYSRNLYEMTVYKPALTKAYKIHLWNKIYIFLQGRESCPCIYLHCEINTFENTSKGMYHKQSFQNICLSFNIFFYFETIRISLTTIY